MSILYLVLPLALVIVLAAVLAFSWAARRGQFDDLQTPALRMLHDDDDIAPRPPPRPAGDALERRDMPESGGPAGRAP